MLETGNHIEPHADIGIVGHGETIEACFANTAHVMFSLMASIEDIHQIQIITFEFEEADVEQALIKWLNLLLEKSHEHQLLFGDFRLKREGNVWKATVAGEPWREEVASGGMVVKAALPTMLMVKKLNHLWEARCVVDAG